MCGSIFMKYEDSNIMKYVQFVKLLWGKTYKFPICFCHGLSVNEKYSSEMSAKQPYLECTNLFLEK